MIENQILIGLREIKDLKNLEASSLSKSEQKKIKYQKLISKKNLNKSNQHLEEENKNDMMNPVSSRGDGLNMLFRVPVD
ncbi:hypothetical protein CROQUDRAFT_651091 [Cronartium quercuum f. sp. fusiforme G11]|uniref:Uncharacterized protein n=1 Tax=Cronartium quercuum f. sp. fusiforme G11 TaxID=708437 RepID=A0A9P6TGD4_9BASI|nr:hypothetical protein CROQUDRAFT_651091 [Cronartium quercuum f. sp. fusiforme G11]